MDLIADIFLAFVNKFLGQAALLLGTITFIGYLFLGKKIYEAFAGFIKAYVGFMILQVGTGGLVKTFRPIIENLSSRYGIKALVIDPYFGQTSATETLEIFDSLQFVGYVMLIAFVLNIIYVLFRKLTKIRALFITGHIMYQQSAVLLWALYWVLEGAGQNPASFSLTLTIGLLLGTYWSVGSNLVLEATQEVTDGANFTVGHQQMFGAWLVYKASHKLGNKKNDINHVDTPGFLSILNDNVVANTLLMTIFVGTIMVILGRGAFEYDQSKYFFFTYILETTAKFAVYIAVLQMGVRMFVTELTISFQGISDKLLKGAVPAVDCAVTFGFSPNAPTYGFIFGFFGQIIAIFTLVAIKSPVLIIAGFIALFFDNGTLAVFANKAGGRRAAIIVPIIAGMIQVFGSALVLSVLKDGPAVVGWMGMFDWATLWTAVVLLAERLGLWIPIIIIPFMMVIPQLQYRRHKETYFSTMRDNVE